MGNRPVGAIDRDVVYLVSNLPLLQKAWRAGLSDRATAAQLGVSYALYRAHLLSFRDRLAEKEATVAAVRLAKCRANNAERQRQFRARAAERQRLALLENWDAMEQAADTELAALPKPDRAAIARAARKGAKWNAAT